MIDRLPDANSRFESIGVIQETPPPTYEEVTTATYAATRFPGTFAAIVRVFDELKSRLPNFKPRNMLDFGAGPGTAVWAAQEVGMMELANHSANLRLCE